MSDMTMNTNSRANRPRTLLTLYWLCRGVFIETIRRREVSVVFLFTALFVVGAIVARFVGTESHAAAVFILNLGLSLVWMMAILLAILLAARQFPDELETRSLYPLLAKPLSRCHYILGKWLATSLAVIVTLLVLNGISLVASPWPEKLFAGMLLQAIALEAMAVGVIAAVTILLSIRLPKTLAMVIAGLIAFGAEPATSLVLSRFMPGTGHTIASWVMSYVPNVGRLDLLTAFSGGAPSISFFEFSSRLVYGAVVILFSTGLATFLLERRSL